LLYQAELPALGLFIIIQKVLYYKLKIIKAGQLLYKEGLVDARAGNISVRLDGRVLITRTGRHVVMLRIALTGNIGSGKSTVAEFFKECGFYVFDADRIIKGFYEERGKVYEEVLKAFGR
jgi:hypothetical protein